MITPKKPPYAGTLVDPDETKNQIDKLLGYTQGWTVAKTYLVWLEKMSGGFL